MQFRSWNETRSIASVNKAPKNTYNKQGVALTIRNTTVGAQRGGTTHLPPATARPHHRCVGDTTLAIRVPERVQYKIAVLTYMYKVLHDSAPRYLGPLVAVADLLGRRALPSASTSRLAIPPIKLSTVGSRAFPVAAAQVWNGLPEAVISSS